MDRRRLLLGATGLAATAMAAPVWASDTAEVVKAQVEATVVRFFELGGDVTRGMTPPKVFISFTPALSWVNDPGTELHSVAWSQCPPPFQGLIASWAKGAEMTPEAFFGEVFNAFLVPHELSHCIDIYRGQGADRSSLYQAEVHANRVAVAFWLAQEGGEARMARLMKASAVVLSNLPSPVPEGQDKVAYFNANYEALGDNPPAYGWYQFRMFLDAWDARKEADLQTLLLHKA
jgi:hypothetical protein